MSFATSYIKTENSQVTRASENASVDDLSGWFNESEGTFYFDFIINNATNFRPIIGTNSNELQLVSLVNGNIQTDLREFDLPDIVFSNSIEIGKKYRCALSINKDQVAGALDGVSSFEPVTSYTGMGALSQLLLYKREGFASGETGGTIQNTKYIPRALSAEEIQILTAPEA